MFHGIVMFSGGLDSVMAVHLLKSQGLSVLALHFVLPFYSGIGYTHNKIKKYAAALDVPLRIEEEKEDYLEMIKDPQFGFGKNANPCLDCRIYRLKKAHKIMIKEGAAFIATGEVIGQRPMSQRMDCLHQIENKAGLKGLLLRPLSAKHLVPTIPELNGLINRDLLLGITGRSRRVQLNYSKEHGLLHATPAGGCILTHIDPSRRYLEMGSYNADVTLTDFKLLAWGRHFRINPQVKVVVSRNESENNIIENIATPEDYYMHMAEIPGPVALINKRNCSISDLELAASILVRFSKARNESEVAVKVFNNSKEQIIRVSPASEDVCEKIRI